MQQSNGSRSLSEIAKDLYGVVRLLSQEEIPLPYFHEIIRKHFTDMYSNDLVAPLEPSNDIMIPVYNIHPIREELLLRYLMQKKSNKLLKSHTFKRVSSLIPHTAKYIRYQIDKLSNCELPPVK